MKKQLIPLVLIIIGLLVCGTAFGSESATHPQKGFGPPPPRGPMGLLSKYQADNIMIQVLSTLTGQTTDVIAAEIQGKSVKDILDSYGIDRTAFQTAMDARMIIFINKAVECGSITQTQADEIITDMQNRPAPPESSTTTTSGS